MPAAPRAIARTNTSFEPSSEEMKPNPLAPLKNLTVPEILISEPAKNGPRLAHATQVRGIALGR
jgi:hypothetical protein